MTNQEASPQSIKRNIKYRVKEMFYTLQGEGAQAGRPAVFCRFSRCNLWDGKESSRARSVCQFCDTDFIGTNGQNGGTYKAEELVQKVASLWPTTDTHNKGVPFVVCTGGEPLLQLNQALIDVFHAYGFEVGVETNGTQIAPDGIDWLCVSPKANADVILKTCHELKLVYPQPLAMPERFEHIQADHYYLQPMADHSGKNDKDNLNAHNTQQTLAYCLANPRWKLSLQTHKWLGIE